MLLLRRLFVLAFWAALVFALVMALLPKPPTIPGDPGDKVQHIIAFATLTALARLAYPQVRATTLILGLALFGALIEVGQMTPGLGRDGSIDDWLADIAAVGAVLLVVEPLRLLLARRKRSAPEHMVDEPAKVAESG
jgi:VanZ family protein